jgi:hypothetical protein
MLPSGDQQSPQVIIDIGGSARRKSPSSQPRRCSRAVGSSAGCADGCVRRSASVGRTPGRRPLPRQLPARSPGPARGRTRRAVGSGRRRSWTCRARRR